MDLELRGRNVLVTGASKGIGLACARAFAAEGCHVHIAARSAAELEKNAAELSAQYKVRVTPHVCDLGVSENLRALARACGAIDVLVNNAGAIPGGYLADIDEQRWRTAWDLKVFGYINLTREVYAAMRERGSGVIVNVIGLAGERNRPEYIAGTTGNAALMAFTRALGAESVDYGVRVVGINPGRIETERQVKHMKETAGKEFGDAARWTEVRARIVEGLPFKRSGKPEEVADLATFLASARAAYISATIVTIDAGQSLRERK
jgi:NAD(P)-dependent dehydrogenase (short-subunit alcohol dehydrogenase family)